MFKSVSLHWLAHFNDGMRLCDSQTLTGSSSVRVIFFNLVSRVSLRSPLDLSCSLKAALQAVLRAFFEHSLSSAHIEHSFRIQ